MARQRPSEVSTIRWPFLSALFVAQALLGGCAEAPAALYPPFGYEADDRSCSDQIDNDQDGIDCDDPDCLAVSTRCGNESRTSRCSRLRAAGDVLRSDRQRPGRTV